jgi:hypothetical protein
VKTGVVKSEREEAEKETPLEATVLEVDLEVEAAIARGAFAP